LALVALVCLVRLEVLEAGRLPARPRTFVYTKAVRTTQIERTRKMSTGNRDWILAGEAGLNNMYFGQLAEGKSAVEAMKRLAEDGSQSVPLELFNTRLVLHQTVPLVLPDGGLTLQTLFKIMPFPTNPDGAHIALKATTIIDVEGDATTKEMLLGQLSDCRAMEQAEKGRRSKITVPSITLAHS
jgi:hypothetical protein